MQEIIKKRIKEFYNTYKVEDFKVVLEILTGFAMGFISSKLTFFNAPLVFGIIYLTVSGFKSRIFFFFSFVGVFTSYFILPSGTAYFTAVFSLIIFIVTAFMRERGLLYKLKNKIYFYVVLIISTYEVSMFMFYNKNMGTVFFILLAINIVIGIFGYMIYDYIFLKEEGVTYKIFAKAGIDKFIYGFFFIMVFAALFNMKFYDISVGNCLLYAFLINITLTQSVESAALYGLMTGLCAGILQRNGGYLISVMPLSCLFGGLTKKHNKYLAMAVFLFSNILLGTFYKAYFNSLAPLYEVLIGFLIYFCVPSFIKEKLNNVFSSVIPSKEKNNREKDSSLVANKLENISNVFSKLAYAVKEENSKEDLSAHKKKMYENCVVGICNNCGLGTFCFNKGYKTTKNAFEKISDDLFKNGYINDSNIPKDFSEKCIKVEKIKGKMEQYYNFYKQDKKIAREKEKSKNILKTQFENMSQLFYTTAQNIKENITFDCEAEKTALSLFKEKDIEVSELSIYKDEEGRYLSEFYILQQPCPVFLIKKAAEIIEFCTGSSFSVINTSQIENKTFIKLGEKERFVIKTSVFQKNKSGENVCGDSILNFKHSNGKSYFCISDGMGSGKQANETSSICLSIFKDLIMANFNFENAVEMLNTSMAVKILEDNFATVDFLEIDLYDGKGSVIKAGSAPTYILRKGKIKELFTKTLPCGLVSEMKYDKINFNFNADDVIIMISDGVLSLEKNNLFEIFLQQDYRDIKKASENIFSYYRNISSENEDDITVMILKVEEN